MTSNEYRTVYHLRKQGVVCDYATHWKFTPPTEQEESSRGKGKRGRGRRVDLYGWQDVQAIREGCIVGIQCTSVSDMSTRRKKMLTDCREKVLAWLQAGGKVEIWGWKKVAKIGKDGTKTRQQIWQPKIEFLTIHDFM